LTGPQLLRISQRNSLQTGGVNANHRKIGRRIVADGVGGSAPPVGQRHFDPGGVMHDVAIGENQAIGRKYEAGATSASLPRLAGAISPGRLRRSDMMYLDVYD
jgi:hypothetical protein